jgi:hypothetical protein
MRGEELARPVDQQIVQLRLQTTPVGQPKIVTYPIELRSQRLLPSGLVDRDPILGDFPRVADAAVEARLILETMAGRSGDFGQLARCGWGETGKRMRPTPWTSRLRSSAAAVWRVANEPDEPIRESSRLTSSNMDLTFAIFSL